MRSIDDPVMRVRASDQAQWFHVTDAQFSTRALLDGSAEVVERVVYDAYGNARHHWGASTFGARR